jgi:hypothetical protein
LSTDIVGRGDAEEFDRGRANKKGNQNQNQDPNRNQNQNQNQKQGKKKNKQGGGKNNNQNQNHRPADALSIVQEVEEISTGPPATPQSRIRESGGAHLIAAQVAFYGKHRLAKDRFMWTLPFQHDDRVSYVMDWINSMSWELATVGVRALR